MADFKGRHYQGAIILSCVRWYCKYGISYRGVVCGKVRGTTLRDLTQASESISFGAHQMRDGVSLSDQKRTQSVVSESDIMKLKDLECFLKFPGDLPITKLHLPYLHLPPITQRFRPVTQNNQNRDKGPKNQETPSDVSVEAGMENIDFFLDQKAPARNVKEPWQGDHNFDGSSF